MRNRYAAPRSSSPRPGLLICSYSSWKMRDKGTRLCNSSEDSARQPVPQLDRYTKHCAVAKKNTYVMVLQCGWMVGNMCECVKACAPSPNTAWEVGASWEEPRPEPPEVTVPTSALSSRTYRANPNSSPVWAPRGSTSRDCASVKPQHQQATRKLEGPPQEGSRYKQHQYVLQAHCSLQCLTTTRLPHPPPAAVPGWWC
jgi:hypothetical protein